MSSLWLRDQISRVEDLLRQEAQELSIRLLPNWDHLDRAATYTGLSWLHPRLLENLQLERERIEAQRSQLKLQPEFHQSAQVAAQSLQERSRLLEHQADLAQFIRSCHNHPRFAELIHNGYGTQRYATPFWRWSYYADRRAAQEICHRTRKKNFANLLRDYQSANESFDLLGARVEELGRRPLSARHEWDRLGKCLESLDQVHLTTAQTRIQLALCKGGPIWKHLAQASLDQDLASLIESTGLLKDQLDQLHSQRSGSS